MNNTIHFAEIRKIREAANDLKALDPHTAVTESFIRKLVKNRKIPVIKNGRTQLINLKKLIEVVEEMSSGDMDMNDDYIAPVYEVLA